MLCSEYFIDFTGTESVSHIPEVMLVESVPNWLSMDAYDCMAKDINTIPDNIRQLLHSCCMCVYSKSWAKHATLFRAYPWDLIEA